MILSPDLVKLVRSGRKTQHRVLHEPPMKPKRCYAVQTAKGKPAVLHITITDIRGPERLETIDFQGARKEGFRTVEDFRTHWIALHARWNPLELVWVISFELGDLTDRPRLLKARSSGDPYTTVPALALPNTAEEVSADVHGHYAEAGHLRYESRMMLGLEEWRVATAKLRGMASTAKQRKRLESIEYQIVAIEAEVQR